MSFETNDFGVIHSCFPCITAKSESDSEVESESIKSKKKARSSSSPSSMLQNRDEGTTKRKCKGKKGKKKGTVFAAV